LERTALRAVLLATKTKQGRLPSHVGNVQWSTKVLALWGKSHSVSQSLAIYQPLQPTFVTIAAKNFSLARAARSTVWTEEVVQC